jgi:hypothetical protein
MALEHLREPLPQRPPLLLLRRVLRPPGAPYRADAPEVDRYRSASTKASEAARLKATLPAGNPVGEKKETR